MWQYKKKLEYPVNIKNPNPALAKVIITQFGGPDGELGAAMRYLSQRYTAPCNEVKAILSDIGGEAPEMNYFRGFRFFWQFTLFTVYTFCNRVAPFHR